MKSFKRRGWQSLEWERNSEVEKANVDARAEGDFPARLHQPWRYEPQLPLRSHGYFRVRELIWNTLGPKFSADRCVCECDCGASTSNFPADQAIQYIGDNRADDQVLTILLEIIHQSSICPDCYRQHRWGKPLTNGFVQYMREALRNLKGWQEYSPPPRPRQDQASREFGVVLDDEPLRYKSLSHAEYFGLLDIPHWDGSIRCADGEICGKNNRSNADKVSIVLSVNELRLAILAEVSKIGEYVVRIFISLCCTKCALNGSLIPEVRDFKNSYYKNWVARLINPEWVKFYTLGSTPRRMDRLKSGDIEIQESAIRSQNLEMLAKLRQRLVQSGDTVFITKFFEMADELKWTLGHVGGGSGAPRESSYGGGPGASDRNSFWDSGGGGAGHPD